MDQLALPLTSKILSIHHTLRQAFDETRLSIVKQSPWITNSSPEAPHRGQPFVKKITKANQH